MVFGLPAYKFVDALQMSSAMSFEILDRAFMLFGFCAAGKSAQVATLPRALVPLPGVEPEFTCFQFSYHVRPGLT
jgi:hypothetical protein